MAYRIKNWEKHQHYQTGRGTPPWIKLYRQLLDDKEWFQLSGDSSKFLINCWILCAETKGLLPDRDTLAFRLRLDSKTVEKHLSACKHWIIPDASVVLADCKQLATPETETETEGTNVPVAKRDVLPKIPVDVVVSAYHEILPELPAATLLNDKRKKSITNFCKWVLTSKRSDGERRATNQDEAITWIRSYFDRARRNDFLMGRTQKVNGHTGWECDIDFLLSEKGKIQVIEKTKALA